jgi:hypothetical protein
VILFLGCRNFETRDIVLLFENYANHEDYAVAAIALGNSALR